MYDGVLRIELPEEATIVGYADDIALVVVDKRLGKMQWRNSGGPMVA